MVTLWSQLENNLLDGSLRLGKCLSSTENSATYRLETSDGPNTRVVLVMSGDVKQADERYRQWKSAATIHHRNLVQIFHAGRTEFDNVPLAYLVAEHADETLADALKERALEPHEAHQVVDSIAIALQYVHTQGLVHGEVKASRIFAVNDVIKLSSDSLQRPAADIEGLKIGQASDIQALGATLYETLTQKTPGDKLISLPPPLGTIVLRCLAKEPLSRPNAKEVSALLRGETVPIPVPAKPAVPQLIEKPASQIQRPASTQQPSVQQTAEQVVQQTRQEIEQPRAAAAGAGSGGAARSTSVPVASAPVASASAATAAPVTTAPGRLNQNPAPAPGQSSNHVKTSSAFRNSPSRSPEQPEVRRRPVQAAPPSSGTNRAQPHIVPVARREDRPVRSGFPAWVLVSLVVLAIIAIFGLIRLRHNAAAPKTTARNSSARTKQAARSTPTPPPPVAETPTTRKPPAEPLVRPDTTEEKPSPTRRSQLSRKKSRGIAATPAPAVPETFRPSETGANAAASQDSSSGERPYWRVIVYTYNQQNDAERRVSSLNKNHPDMKAEVFSNGDGQPFLVVVGGQMDRSQAAQVRQQAISAGLPRDSYLQNFSR